MKIQSLLLTAILVVTLFSGCAQSSEEMQDGYYTAESASFDDYGWKEFITICIRDNRIVAVDYNAKDANGFIKSWDMDYMRAMNATDNTYPSRYSRSYAVALLNKQTPDRVDAVSGATHSHTSFQLLAQAAIDQARAGDRAIAFVELPVSGE